MFVLHDFYVKNPFDCKTEGAKDVHKFRWLIIHSYIKGIFIIYFNFVGHWSDFTTGKKKGEYSYFQFLLHLNIVIKAKITF